MRFREFSAPQLTALTWWCDGSPYRGRDAIICDGAVRSGKTVCMGLGFFLWAMQAFDGQAFGLCGKTVVALRRNVVDVLLPLLREIGFEIREKRSVGRLEMEWGGHANGSSVVEVTDGPYIHVFAGDECYTLANMEQKRPTGSCVDAARTKEFVEHYSGEHYLVHTCHDASLKSEEV